MSQEKRGRIAFVMQLLLCLELQIETVKCILGEQIWP